MEEELPLCECGCGKRVSKVGNRFILGHQNRGVKFSSKVRKNMSIGQKKRFEDPVELEKLRLKAIKQFSDQSVRDEMSDKLKEYCKSSEGRKKIAYSHLKEKDPLPPGQKNKIPTNKNCTTYLGGIAENILIGIFKEVKVMPIGNPGFDFICNKDKKIDVKSSALGRKHGRWDFIINKNTTVDYFLCIAFESRDDLTHPVHLWLIPGRVLNHLTGAVIHKTTIKKWEKYEQPLDKIIECCNNIRGK